MAIRETRIIGRRAWSTDHKALQWLFGVLTCQLFIRNCFTAVVLKHWNKFSERARQIQNIRKHEEQGPRKRMLVISISQYIHKWQPLHGPKIDWRFWAMLGTSAFLSRIDRANQVNRKAELHALFAVSAWNVEVLADSLPTDDPLRRPTRGRIRRFARDLMRGNGIGDELVIVFAGHCDSQGLVLADGSYISREELRAWFVKPLAGGARLWAFFDCCESQNLLSLPHRLLQNQDGDIEYKPLTSRNNGEQIKGTIISIGSSADISREMNLKSKKASSPCSTPLHCGFLTWATCWFFDKVYDGGNPRVVEFISGLKRTILKHQELQITTSEKISDPVLPVLRAPPGLPPSL